jgi:outer membrane protein insertion porin family/translocation and assembly module TamA
VRTARSCLATVVLIAALLGGACREEGDIKISSLKFEGVDAVDEGALRDALQTKKGSWLPWGRKRYFDRRAFEADLQRIHAFYRDRGYPDARVSSFDVQLNDVQDEVDLTINIAEGEPVRVAEIRFEGFDVLQGRERGRLRRELPLQAERPLDRQLAVASRERAMNALRDVGYPYAEVQLIEEEAAPRQARIVLRATPGPVAYFGPVEINGQSSVGEYVIRRKLTYEPGEKFTRTKMRESQRNLYGLELFEFVNIESNEDRTQQPTEIPTRVTVAEGKHRKVNFGIGYGTEEHARARVRWDHVNFFGGARQAGFEGKWSSLDRGVRVDLTEPYFYAPHLSLRFDGQGWQAREPVYALNSVGGRVTLRHQANPQNQWSVSLFNEFQRSRIDNEALEDFRLRDELISLGLDPRFGTQEGTLGGVAFEVNRNTTNNILDARRGYVLNGRVEQTGKWLWGDFNYWSVMAEGRHYFAVRRRAVIANRLRIGSIDALGDLETDVPFYKRYFLGGASSLRGWGRFEVSPLSGFGLPIGGHTMLEGSTEIRLPVWGKIGAVAFVDYGNVWSDSWGFDLGDLRYSAGPGLRYVTPIGPARVDFGYQLNPTDNLRVNGELQQRRWRVHFSIGQAF